MKLDVLFALDLLLLISSAIGALLSSTFVHHSFPILSFTLHCIAYLFNIWFVECRRIWASQRRFLPHWLEFIPSLIVPRVGRRSLSKRYLVVEIGDVIDLGLYDLKFIYNCFEILFRLIGKVKWRWYNVRKLWVFRNSYSSLYIIVTNILKFLSWRSSTALKNFFRIPASIISPFAYVVSFRYLINFAWHSLEQYFQFHLTKLMFFILQSKF